MRWLLLKWFDRHDPAAVMQRRPEPGGTYDERKAVAGKLRQLQREASRRRLEDSPSRKAEKVTPFRRQG